MDTKGTPLGVRERMMNDDADPFEPLGVAANRVIESLDPYAYWRAKLLGEDPDPVEPRTLMPCGFWKLRSGEPLAVWVAGAERCALRGFRGSERVLPIRTMEAIAESGGFGVAVAEADYRAAFAEGRWPDTDFVVASQTGRNRIDADNFDALRDQIEAALAGTDEYVEIINDEVAARAQSLRSRLLELSGEADKKRETEKKPHWEACKAVDARWQPIVKAAKDAADTIRSALGRFETAKMRAAQEAARKAAEEVSAAAPSPPVTAVPTKIKGGYGRTARAVTVNIAKIADQDAVYGHFRARAEVIGVLATLAQKAVDAGGAVPGVVIEQERRVS